MDYFVETAKEVDVENCECNHHGWIANVQHTYLIGGEVSFGPAVGGILHGPQIGVYVSTGNPEADEQEAKRRRRILPAGTCPICGLQF